MKGRVTVLLLAALLVTGLYTIHDLKATVNHPANMACTDCHLVSGEVTSDNAGTLIADQEELCKSCHANAITASHPTGFQPQTEIPPDFPLDWKGDLTCSTCHDIHGEERGLSRVGLFGRELCLSCHEEEFFTRMIDGGMSIIVSGHLDPREPLEGSMDTFSIQCMSCHESLSDDLNVQISGNVIRHNSNRSNHPVGVLYQNSINYGGYRDAVLLPAEISLPNGKLSCISCHHGYTEQHGKLVMTNEGSRLCFSCHDL